LRALLQIPVASSILAHGKTMKDVHDDVSGSNSTNRTIQATLAIPETAIRVLAAPPETLTQRNVEAVTGLPARTFLELIRSPGFPLRVRHIGKLRVVNRAAFVQWLEEVEPNRDLAETLVRQANEDPTSETEEQAGANALLATVGLRQRAPKRRARRKR
jgi:hypothetical protein